MKVFVAEDEAPARERLLETLARVAPQAQLAGWAASVKATREWLRTQPPPDLLLLDLQLADGLSLELFEGEAAVASPVIFVTAYDEFALDAFQAQAVDYLLKPVDDARLALALERLARWRRLFTRTEAADLAATLAAPQRPRWRQRLLGQRGAVSVVLPVAEVACIVSLDKTCHALRADGQRFVLEGTLADWEAALDPARFFRASRQMLLAADAVQRLQPAGKGRLQVDLRPAEAGPVTISQERAAAFREWLAGG